MLSKHQHGAELRGNVPHEASVLSERLDLALVAGVEKYRTADFVPITVIDQIFLLESLVGGKAEVVEALVEPPNVVLPAGLRLVVALMAGVEDVN